MNDATTAMLAKMREQRETWLELDDIPRRAICIRCPGDVEMLGFAGRLRAAQLPELLERQVVAWRGFTEADLLGASTGGSHQIPFAAELFAEYMVQHGDVMEAAASTLLELIEQQMAKRAAEKKPPRRPHLDSQ